MNSKAQIVATIGPASKDPKILREMIRHNMDVARLNFSWSTHDDHMVVIKTIREIAKKEGRNIPIIQDLSGPRVQEAKGHEFKKGATKIITKKDLNDLKFGIEQKIDYVAMSYVGRAKDIIDLRKAMKKIGKVIPIIAKIERKEALKNVDEIIKEADAVMVARGDLGNEIPLEQIPFVEKEIIQKCKKAKKKVIVATQMMLSMTKSDMPTRAEVTDVVYAIMNGADAVMLSEESASGKYPIEAVKMMERCILESEKHLLANIKVNNF